MKSPRKSAFKRCQRCDQEKALIPTELFKKSIEQTGTQAKYPKIPNRKWFCVCPICDAYALGIETTHPWPILCIDDVIRTAEDLFYADEREHPLPIESTQFRISERALRSIRNLVGATTLEASLVNLGFGDLISD